MPKYSRKYSRPSRSHGSSRKPSRGGLRLFGSKRKLLQKYVKAADKLDLTAEQKIRFLKAKNRKGQKKLLRQFQEENDRARADGAMSRRRKRSEKFRRNVGRLLAVGTLLLALGYQTHSKSKLAELLRDNVYMKDLLKHQLSREEEGHKGTRGKLGEEESEHEKSRKREKTIKNDLGKKLRQQKKNVREREEELDEIRRSNINALQKAERALQKAERALQNAKQDSTVDD